MKHALPRERRLLGWRKRTLLRFGPERRPLPEGEQDEPHLEEVRELIYAVDLGPIEAVALEVERFEGDPPPGVPLLTKIPVSRQIVPMSAFSAGVSPVPGMLETALANLAAAARKYGDVNAPEDHPARLLSNYAEVFGYVRDAVASRGWPTFDVFLQIIELAFQCGRLIAQVELLAPAEIGSRVSARGQPRARAKDETERHRAIWERALAEAGGNTSAAARIVAEERGTSAAYERRWWHSHRRAHL
ncbi:MAG: hypothetical protein NZ555_13685 [Geminicoccaceae bacterium]|nr:hypothetical protein [Geminicoccaceae bacterium]